MGQKRVSSKCNPPCRGENHATCFNQFRHQHHLAHQAQPGNQSPRPGLVALAGTRDHPPASPVLALLPVGSGRLQPILRCHRAKHAHLGSQLLLRRLRARRFRVGGQAAAGLLAASCLRSHLRHQRLCPGPATSPGRPAGHPLALSPGAAPIWRVGRAVGRPNPGHHPGHRLHGAQQHHRRHPGIAAAAGGLGLHSRHRIRPGAFSLAGRGSRRPGLQRQNAASLLAPTRLLCPLPGWGSPALVA